MARKPKKARPSAEVVSEQLELAKAEAGSALGSLLELYRPYLLAIAADTMDSRLKAKDGASDLVQKTFVVAHRRFSKFDGDSEFAMRRWLRGILLKVISEWHRRYRETAQRSANQEVSLERAASLILLNRLSVSESKSPASEIDFQDNVRALDGAMNRLPVEYRQVILWRNYERRKFKSIGKQLNRSPDAVRMLHLRAVRRLAHEMTRHDK